MQRIAKKIKVSNSPKFKSQLLNWAQQFETAVWLDSNHHNQKHSKFDAVLAVDIASKIEIKSHKGFEQLKSYQHQVNDYIFGFLSYDLKNEVEELTSTNYDGLDFPDLFFFQPKKIFLIKDDEVLLNYIPSSEMDIESDWQSIQDTDDSILPASNKNIKIKLRIHKDEYFQKINEILDHIHRGDIYEANFCQEFFSENSNINPAKVYQNLNEISKAPFATFLKLNEKYLLSASPERYIQKQGNTIISQPIKGTQKRAASEREDKILIKQLEQNQKERSENIMIVDLVRNDLSRSAVKGTVKVDELCKVYTFEQVHQLISTVSCKVSDKTNSVDIIKDTFPMGSMTGAPKISAMQIIEELEETKRGLYSGAVGYFTPSGDFDFNVIIRSILYNAQKNYISYSVGGAITALSTPEKEYEECLLKAKAMKQVLLNTN